MKKIFLLLVVATMGLTAFAQQKPEAVKKDQPKQVQLKKELPQPFKGGIDSMMLFFKDNLAVTPQIKAAKASGTVTVKFAAETKGMINNIVIFYADDAILTQPVIDAMRRSNGKWVIPTEVKDYDFVVQFVFNYKPDGPIKPAAMKAVLDYYQQHKPIITHDQVPLNYATLLPTIVVDYQ